MRVALLRSFCCLRSLAIAPALRGAGAAKPPMLSIELVDPKVLRVCADPHNLPFSNEKGEGFENKLAEMFAEKLDKKLAYTFFPQATGFVRDDARLASLRRHHGISARRRSGAEHQSRITAPPMR